MLNPQETFTASRGQNQSSNPPSDGPAAELLARYLPPHSIEAEQAVLGAMLIEPANIEKAAEMLHAEDFYRDNHKVIFECILSVTARNVPVDLITVQEELRMREKFEEVGGFGYLTALFDRLPSVAYIDHYVKIVQEKSVLRRLIDAAQQISNLARAPEPEQTADEVVDAAERLVFEVAQKRTSKYFEPLPPLLLSVFDRAEELNERKQRVSGVSTGIEDFDLLTAGLQKSDLIIVAARPSMGKTSFSLTIAQHVAVREKLPVAIFSLEMSAEQLALRILCSEAQVSSHKVRTGYLNETEFGRMAEVLSGPLYEEAPIFIDDATESTVMTMRAKCRRLAAERGLGLVMVDYLQLMRSHRKIENRVQEIGDIARGLKSLARELQVPVIALSQLSRSVEHRDNKRPMLSDLRDSGSIEAEADLVCFLYRESYYKMREATAAGQEFDRPRGETIEETEVIVGKHRNGPTGTIKVGFMSDYAKFVNLETHLGDGSTGF